MKYGFFILSILFFASCQEDKTIMTWPNQKKLVDYDNYTFQIKSDDIHTIKACYIYTALQPIELDLRLANDRLLARIPAGKQLHAGPARLIVRSIKDQVTIFPFTGKTKTALEKKDFRSPKTLITDSSLTQQQLVYSVGATRNLAQTENEFAIERWKDLAPQKKTYQAQEEKIETSFYVEAGSANRIQLIKAGLSAKQKQQFKTNFLQDSYSNQIADGTRAIFYLEKGAEQIRIEKTVKDGIAKLEVPAYIKTPYSIAVEIGIAQSNKLQL